MENIVDSDIRALDLNLLPVLDVLLEERSVTRAAKRLSLTQSTVSGILSRLRTALDDPLFVRTQQGILPTPRAEAMAAPLKAWIAEARGLVTPGPFDPSRWDATATLAATDYTQHVLLGALLRRLRREAPRLRVAVHPLAFETVADQLARGAFDLAISVEGYLPRELASQKLMKERYVLAMCAKHPLAKKRRITLADFCRYDHLVVSPSGGGFTGPVDETLAARGKAREVRVSVPSFSLVPDLLVGSDLLCTGPERLVRGRKDLRVVAGPVPRAPVEMVAAWHPRVSEDPGHRWLRTVLAEVARKV